MYKQISESKFNKLLDSYEQGGTYQKKKGGTLSASITPAFGKAIYSNVLEDVDNEYLLSLTDNYEYRDAGFRGIATEESIINKRTANVKVLQDKWFAPFKQRLQLEIDNHLKGHYKYTKNDFEITTSGFVKTAPGESCHFHNHTNCMFSGVYYFDTAPNCGDIVFRDSIPQRFDLPVEEGSENFNIFNARSWQYSPKNGLIVMFPAELWHRIEKNRSNTTRYSLAFNVMPVGQIGYSTHDSHCTINLL